MLKFVSVSVFLSVCIYLNNPTTAAQKFLTSWMKSLEIDRSWKADREGGHRLLRNHLVFCIIAAAAEHVSKYMTTLLAISSYQFACMASGHVKGLLTS